LVDASDLKPNIQELAEAIEARDSTHVSVAIGKLMSDWSSVSGGCTESACHMLDGLLKMSQLVLDDVKPCQAALGPAMKELNFAVAIFENGDYASAVPLFATALDSLSAAISTDTCGLKKLADAISKVSPALSGAIVTVEEGEPVKIIVGSADLYQELFLAVGSLQAGRYTDFGMEMGSLLRQLRASKCSTKAFQHQVFILPLRTLHSST